MITPEERERSYERYVLYRDNRARYEAPAKTLLLIAIVGGFYIVFKFGFDVLIIFLIIVLFGGAALFTWERNKNQKSNNTMKSTSVEDIQKLLPSNDTEIVDIKDKTVTVAVSKESAEEIISLIKENADSHGVNINIKKIEENNKMSKKSTDVGYVNKNNQRNNGRTEQKGSGLNQWFYSMECLNCGNTYLANGHDIWLRKCPHCQGGQP